MFVPSNSVIYMSFDEFITISRKAILSVESNLLKPEQVSCILEYVVRANPTAFSSTDLKNIAHILHSFYAANFLAGDIQLLLRMIKFLVCGLVQIL